MNQKDLFIKRNQNLQKLEKAFKIHRNVVCFGLGESEEHLVQKARVCRVLLELGKHFVTEARFVKKIAGKSARADVYVLDDDVAIEVLASEEEDNLEFKNEYYPCRVVGISVSKVPTEYVVERLLN